jgi:hypothetical protein
MPGQHPNGFGPHPRDQQPEQRQPDQRQGGEQKFGPHPREQRPEQRQSEERRGGEQNFGPHQRTGDERLVQGHPHNEQGQQRDPEISGHRHYQHFGEHGYYQGGEWFSDDSYPVYQDTMPDDGVLPPVADTQPLGATDTPEGAPSSAACYVNIPQDQVLDVRDVPSGDNVVSSLENGTDVVIGDQQDTWVQLNDLNNNPLGWVLQDYIQCENNS